MYMRKPNWLKVNIKTSAEKIEVEKILKEHKINTVCKEANCPNLMECYSRKTSTFIILGKVCTRNCTFCNISQGLPRL